MVERKQPSGSGSRVFLNIEYEEINGAANRKPPATSIVVQAIQLYAYNEAWNLLEEMQACMEAPSLVVVVS